MGNAQQHRGPMAMSQATLPHLHMMIADNIHMPKGHLVTHRMTHDLPRTSEMLRLTHCSHYMLSAPCPLLITLYIPPTCPPLHNLVSQTTMFFDQCCSCTSHCHPFCLLSSIHVPLTQHPRMLSISSPILPSSTTDLPHHWWPPA